MRRNVFVSGGTGYIGQRLIRRLLDGGHTVKALAREGSRQKLPSRCLVIPGSALDCGTFAGQVSADDTFVHLVGVSHPAPWKEAQFRSVDLVALQASATAAAQAGVRHFIFISVAHPAPAMKAYIRVRQQCEEILASQELVCTILRPWYVLGPGHRWPRLLRPLYALAERVPALSEGARRLGLVTLEQMVGALHWAVEHPPAATAILDVPAIRGIGANRDSTYFASNKCAML